MFEYLEEALQTISKLDETHNIHILEYEPNAWFLYDKEYVVMSVRGKEFNDWRRILCWLEGYLHCSKK